MYIYIYIYMYIYPPKNREAEARGGAGRAVESGAPRRKRRGHGGEEVVCSIPIGSGVTLLSFAILHY